MLKLKDSLAERSQFELPGDFENRYTDPSARKVAREPTGCSEQIEQLDSGTGLSTTASCYSKEQLDLEKETARGYEMKLDTLRNSRSVFCQRIAISGVTLR